VEAIGDEAVGDEARKILRNGQLFIQRGGVIYSVTGCRIPAAENQRW
jgi:hypothetical protein